MEYQATNDTLQACYKIIDEQKEVLSQGRITQALRCQKQLETYKQKLDSADYKEVTNYKREKFAELMQTREQIEEKLKAWKSNMKGMYKIKHAEKRKETMEKMQELQSREQQETARSGNLEMVNDLT